MEESWPTRFGLCTIKDASIVLNLVGMFEHTYITSKMPRMFLIDPDREENYLLDEGKVAPGGVERRLKVVPR